jgi:hypothetical protein
LLVTGCCGARPVRLSFGMELIAGTARAALQLFGIFWDLSVDERYRAYRSKVKYRGIPMPF